MGKFESMTRDEAYEDRNLAVIALLRLAEHAGLRVGRGSESEGYLPIYIELPTGQVSWHVPAGMIGFELWTRLAPVEFDGHTVEEKRRRMRRYIEGER